MFKLKIIGATYRVIKTAGKFFQNDVVGLCFTDKREIYYSKDVDTGEQQDILLHEIIHAIDYQMDIELTETQVRRIATGLLAVFKDNPTFYERYLK